MSADAKPEERSTIARLAVTIAGILLMVGPPYAFDMLDLTSRFQHAVIAVMELPCLAVGFVLLYLGLRERRS